MTLLQRPVLITGCSSGIGHAAALAFRAAGFQTVVATARGGRARLGDLRTAGCETLDLDVADETSMVEAVRSVEAAHGAVGVLVNNAGYAAYGAVEELDLDDVRRQFEVNVFGLMRMTQLVLPAMRAAGEGRIINVSSVAGRVTMPGGAAYHASKYAVEAIADALRVEVAPFGIEVVNVLPGPVATAFQGTAIAGLAGGKDSPYASLNLAFNRFLRKRFNPGGPGVLKPEDVAAAIVHAATARRPRTRYSVGLLARLGPAAAMIPAPLRDAVLRRSMR